MITLEKFTAPNDITNCEEYGTKWVANLESGIQVFFQTSRDKDHPKWVRLGDIVEFLYVHKEIRSDIETLIKEMVSSYNSQKINQEQ